MRRLPSRPKGVKRPGKVADPKRSPLDRSYAQTLRTDRKLSAKSQADRASFWANVQRQTRAEADQETQDNLDQIGQGTLAENSQFDTANIELATLQSAPAPAGLSTDEFGSVAGLGESGMAPPPPPR